MSRPKNHLPVLKLRKERRDKSGKITHKAQYFIYEDNRQHLLGIGPDDPESAKAALREYVAKRHAEEVAKPSKRQRRSAAETPIADVIAHYSLRVAPRYEATDMSPEKTEQKNNFLFRMEALIGFWGDKTVDDIDADTCAEFGKFILVNPKTKAERQISVTVTRRCLEDLRAAVKRYIKDRQMLPDGDYVFELPEAGEARYGFFTRDQMARLVRAAYRKKGTYSFTGKRAKNEKRGQTKVIDTRPRRHIARFLLVGAYMGTRTARIERASFYQEIGRPWADVDAGIFYRSWQGEVVSGNKRAGTVIIPDNLLSHMRRWKKNGARYVVEYQPGKTGSTASAYFRLLRETLTADEIAAQDLNRHTLRHTCATWLMQAGEGLDVAADYLETTEKIIDRHYGHHHPDHRKRITAAFTKNRPGRAALFGREEKREEEAATPANSPAVAAEVRRAIRDILELSLAPLVTFSVLDSTPDAGLSMLRESVKRAARSGDWSIVIEKDAVAA